jgi:ribonuclease J
MLFRHREYVKNHIPGYSDDNIVLIENGDMLEIDEFGARVVERHELYKTFIDEESLEEVEYDVVRERKRLAAGGTISLVVTVDKSTHRLVGDPQVSFNGVAGLSGSNGFAAEARSAVAEAIAEMKQEQIADRAVFRENLRIHLKRFVQSGIGTKPVIVTTVVEV